MRRAKKQEYFQQRRHEVKRILTAEPIVPRHAGSQHQLHEDHVVRLRSILEQLGAGFAAFGRYLSSRPDVLSLPDCLELSLIRDSAPATPYETVRQVVFSQLADLPGGAASVRHAVRFDPEPFESRLLYQLHYGEVGPGELVVVKLIHQHLRLDVDLKLIPMLSSIVAPLLSDFEQFHALVDDFRYTILEAIDCRRTADSLESLGHDCRESEALTVPKVFRDLCSSHVLVTERLDGTRLDKYLARFHQPDGWHDGRSCTIDGYVPDEIARRLVDVWLTQVFDGSMLPAELRAENILIRSATELAIVDGAFGLVPRALKGSLLNYFCANAGDEPSKALAALLKELDGTNRQVSEATLDRQFRQVVAFRDGGWDDGGRANCLSDTLFAQWRLASKHGYRPLRHLVRAYRGTFHIALLARQLAPDRDSFLEGVKDLRLTKLLHDIGTMVQPSYWGGQADRLASLMVLGPGFLDEALKSVSEKPAVAAPSQPTPRPKPHTRVSVVLITLLIAVLVFRDGVTIDLSAAWSDRLSAILFIATGCLAVRLFTLPARS